MDSWVSSADKINVSMLDISPRQFRAQLVTDVQPLVPLRQQAFNGRMHDANKSPVRRHTGDDGVESFADRWLIATAASRFDMSRSTFRAASSLTVQFVAMPASSSSE